MFVFGARSKAELATCHKDLQLIHNTAIKTIRIDYGIHEGGRGFKDQLDYFLNGKSKIDPRKPGSLEHAKHVIYQHRSKSLATDIHIASRYNGKALTWQKESLIYVCSYLIATADRLLEQGKITHRLRWGYNWDMDHVIGLDHNFKDLPHLELV